MSVIDATERFAESEQQCWLSNLITAAITPAAQQLLVDAHGEEGAEVYRSFLILLMASGDFGAVDSDDCVANMYSVKNGEQVLGVYPADPENDDKESNVIWLIVDPGHEVLTVLTPSDY